MRETQTTSLCPLCLRRLRALVVRRGGNVWLERTCPEHGQVVALIWRGPPDYDEWRAAGSGPSCGDPAENPDCPTACGLCASHVRQTCCVLLEVTARCDLECPICFASARQRSAPDPSIDEIEGWFRRVLERAPGGNVQLSGGEPTVRDDLPQVVALGRSLGVSFLQLNTNGLRLATDDGYAQTLAAAGLQTVFLQFDGVDDAAYLALRGLCSGRAEGARGGALRRGRPGVSARADRRARGQPRPARADPLLRPRAPARRARDPPSAAGAAGQVPPTRSPPPALA